MKYNNQKLKRTFCKQFDNLRKIFVHIWLYMNMYEEYMDIWKHIWIYIEIYVSNPNVFVHTWHCIWSDIESCNGYIGPYIIINDIIIFQLSFCHNFWTFIMMKIGIYCCICTYMCIYENIYGDKFWIWICMVIFDTAYGHILNLVGDI